MKTLSYTENHTVACPSEADCCNLISSLTHEIKNQLTLISSSLQLAARECPSVSELPLWPQIHQEIQETLALLKDASALARSGQMELRPVPVTPFFRKISDSFSLLMKEKEIDFQTIIEEVSGSEVLSADPLKLKEAITNLLLNAADAVSGKPSSRSILLSVRAENATLCIHVRDNGSGIPDEYLKTLFEPFVTHKAHGTGLGLSIAKSIVEQHGGSIRVYTCTAAPDTYTDFCLKLPVS